MSLHECDLKLEQKMQVVSMQPNGNRVEENTIGKTTVVDTQLDPVVPDSNQRDTSEQESFRTTHFSVNHPASKQTQKK